MAKRISKPTINWAELEKRVPPDQKAKFLGFKAKSDGYFRKVLANPEQPPPINWDEYKKIVPVPGLVDKFKQQYESFKVPYPTDTLSSQIDAQWSTIQGEIKAFASEMQGNIANAKKELDRINALPKYEEMTMEMFCIMVPGSFDPVNKPTFWPHNEEEQPGYLTAEQKAALASGGGHH